MIRPITQCHKAVSPRSYALHLQGQPHGTPTQGGAATDPIIREGYLTVQGEGHRGKRR
jgi:hypothetical protein